MWPFSDWFVKNPKYPPYFERCEIARIIYDTTRDETLISAMTIALYAKFCTDGKRSMKHLANVEHIRTVIRERVPELGIEKLDVLVRIFERQILNVTSHDWNNSLRSGP